MADEESGAEMPKKAKEMSAIEVRRIVHPGTGRNVCFSVGGVDGLQLQVTPTGARSWLLRYTMKGRRHQIGLGPYPDTTLAQARDRARQVKDMIWQGTDPLADRQRLRFAQAVEEYCTAKLSEFRNEKHKKQWRSTLDNYAVPVIGDMGVAEVETQDILRVLQPIWTDKTETASRLRGRIEAVLSWATVAGHRKGDNPARWKGNLSEMLPKPAKIAKAAHQPALALSDAPKWFADLRGRSGIATRALEFVVLTAARSGEVRSATWDEIDFDAGLWIVPAARMKARREHRVPLTKEAVDLLKVLPRMQGCEFVFPAPRGGALSDMSLSACMRRMNEAHEGGYLDRVTGRPAVPHGLRSTFRDWTAEQGYSRDMAEMQLAHSVGTEVERAYRRSDMLDRRRAMMAAWGRFLRGEAGGKVVHLDAVGAE